MKHQCFTIFDHFFIFRAHRTFATVFLFSICDWLFDINHTMWQSDVAVNEFVVQLQFCAHLRWIYRQIQNDSKFERYWKIMCCNEFSISIYHFYKISRKWNDCLFLFQYMFLNFQKRRLCKSNSNWFVLNFK